MAHVDAGVHADLDTGTIAGRYGAAAGFSPFDASAAAGGGAERPHAASAFAAAAALHSPFGPQPLSPAPFSALSPLATPFSAPLSPVLSGEAAEPRPLPPPPAFGAAAAGSGGAPSAGAAARRAALDASLSAHVDSALAALAAGPQLVCPPFGAKAVCGKRSYMEDTFACVPCICEVPLSPSGSAAAPDKMPGRLAMPRPACASDGGASDGAVAAPLTPALTSPVGGAPAAGHGAGSEGGGVATAASAAPSDLSCAASSASSAAAVPAGAAATDTLHFFSVYDGHGGAQASAHCAGRLHHNLLEALGGLLGGGGGPAAAAATAAGDALAAPLGGLSLAAATSGAVATAAAAAECPPAAAAAVAVDGEAVACIAAACEPAAASAAAAAAASHPPRVCHPGAAGIPGLRAFDSFSSTRSEQGMAGVLEEALRRAFLATDAEFSAEGSTLVGSTALVALVGRRKIWLANAGDSRAVLARGGAGIQLTDDHKPEREDEAVRSFAGWAAGADGWRRGGALGRAFSPRSPAAPRPPPRPPLTLSPSPGLSTPPPSFFPQRRSAWSARGGRCCSGTGTA